MKTARTFLDSLGTVPLSEKQKQANDQKVKALNKGPLRELAKVLNLTHKASARQLIPHSPSTPYHPKRTQLIY